MNLWKIDFIKGKWKQGTDPWRGRDLEDASTKFWRRKGDKNDEKIVWVKTSHTSKLAGAGGKRARCGEKYCYNKVMNVREQDFMSSTIVLGVCVCINQI